MVRGVSIEEKGYPKVGEHTQVLAPVEVSWTEYLGCRRSLLKDWDYIITLGSRPNSVRLFELFRTFRDQTRVTA